jgi:hypothetical protein
MNLRLAKLQHVRDTPAAYAARQSEAAVAADARHVERMHQARMHLIKMNRIRVGAVAAEVVAAGAEAADAADAADAAAAAAGAEAAGEDALRDAAEDGDGFLSQEWLAVIAQHIADQANARQAAQAQQAVDAVEVATPYRDGSSTC